MLLPGSVAGQTTAFGPKGSSNQPFISVNDSDNDKVFVTLTSEGGTLNKSSIGGSAENEKVTVAEANAQLQQLAFSGSTRGDASVTVTVSDGFSSSSEIIYLTIPNTAPTITVPKENLSAKIGGLPFSLTSIDVSDVDL